MLEFASISADYSSSRLLRRRSPREDRKMPFKQKVTQGGEALQSDRQLERKPVWQEASHLLGTCAESRLHLMPVLDDAAPGHRDSPALPRALSKQSGLCWGKIPDSPTASGQ